MRRSMRHVKAYSPALRIHVYGGGINAWAQDSVIDPSTTSVWMLLGIANTGTPTIIRNWQLAVRIPGKGSFQAETTFNKGGFRFYDPTSRKETAAYAPEDFLPEKTMIPVPTGSETTGWISGLVKHLPFSSITPGNIEVRFQDAGDNQYFKSIEFTAGPPKDGKRIQVPGMRNPDQK